MWIYQIEGVAMNKILLLNKYDDEALAVINQCMKQNFQLVLYDESNQEILSEIDYIIASGRKRLDSKVLSKTKKLKMIQRTGVGLDSIDLIEVKRLNIPLYVNQGINAHSVAEHTILLILSCLRRVTHAHNLTSNGIWAKHKIGLTTSELRGKTVGLVVLGNIASKTALLLNSFGASVIYYSPNRKSELYENEHGVTYQNFETLLNKSDIISLHCPLLDENIDMINSKTIDLMKDGVILINTARGKLIKTNDVVKELKSGKISRAGFDVYDNEPISKDSEILKLDNVVLTPHIAGITENSFLDMIESAMRNIELFQNGELEQIEENLFTHG